MPRWCLLPPVRAENRADLTAVPVAEPAGNLVVNAKRGDEDEALDACGCHRLNDPCRLHIEVASQIGVYDVLPANGRVQLFPG